MTERHPLDTSLAYLEEQIRWMEFMLHPPRSLSARARWAIAAGAGVALVALELLGGLR